MPDKLIDRQWVDIVLPPPPEINMLLWSLLALAIVLLIATGITLWYRRPRQQMYRLIQSLSRHLSGTNDYKQLLAQLEQGLCQYYQLTYLSPSAALPVDWHAFFKQVTEHRYQRQQPSLDQTQALLQRAMTLLARTDKPYVV